MTQLSCPLCSVSLTSASLEAHLRQELLYPALCCLLCRQHFTCQATAQRHFTGAFSEHPGQVPALLRLNGDAEKEARLEELARLARGGQREVERRLCVCGQCQLLCRAEYEEVAAPFGEPVHHSSIRPGQEDEWQEEGLMSEKITTSHKYASDPQNEPNHKPVQIPYEQPMIEGSEPENHMMDVKPDLKDLKPQLSADGKVACIRCGLRVGKDMFKKHAIGAHSNVRPFNCNLCPHSEKNKPQLKSHQLKLHGLELSNDTFTFSGSEAKVADLVEQCFGAAKDVDWARLRCGPCDKLVNKRDLKSHVSVSHLQKVLHQCKLCDFTSTQLSAGKVNHHVKTKHGVKPGPEAVDSSAAKRYEPVIKNMIPQFFSQE